MPSLLFRARGRHEALARRALLLAGLFLFRSLTLYAELPPARSAAPAVTRQDPAEWQAVRDAAEAAAREQAQRLDDQARRLSRTASSVDDLQGELRTQAQSAKALDASLAGVGSSLTELDKRVAALGAAAAAKDVDASTQAAKMKGLSDELAALREETQGGTRQLKEGLASIASLRDELKQRQSKLDSLTDLLAVLKKDVDANSEEIVEVKQSLRNYTPLAATPASPDAEWWDQALQWKYLPLLAVGLSAVALGVAVTHK